MRHERRDDVLRCDIFVDVPGHTKHPELADLIGALDGAAEDHDRWTLLVHFANVAQHGHAVSLRQPQIEDDEVNLDLVVEDAPE